MRVAEQRTNNAHIAYLDRLRVLAAFAVVVLHVAAQNWYSADISSTAWMVFNVYDSAVRWAVPVFAMISGVVFLSKEIPVKRIFTKYIPRLITAYLFWSLVYALYHGTDRKTMLFHFFAGSFHMWYVPMLVGLYLCIPIYKKIVESDSLVRYFLGISFFCAFLLPYMLLLAGDFGSGLLADYVPLVELKLNMVKLSMPLGFSAYFILGYYLHRVELSKKQEYVLYLLGLAGFAVTAVATQLASQRTSAPNADYYDEFALNTLFQAVAVFVFCKQHCRPKPLADRVCAEISKASFGIYWVHILMRDLLDDKMMVNTCSFLPAISVPVLSIVVFALSFGVSWLIGRIPVVKRYVL